MAPPPSLASLPDVVLREVLAYLLVDTPRKRNRAAILQTCFTLHDLGLPLPYRVVDLSSYSRPRLLGNISTLFGSSGLLTTGGKHAEFGAAVTELRSSPLPGYAPQLELKQRASACGQIHLPNCKNLTLGHCDNPSQILKDLLIRLPVVDITLRQDHVHKRGLPCCFNQSLKHTFGIASQPWKDLYRVEFKGFVWLEILYANQSQSWQLPIHTVPSLSAWRFKILVIDLAEWDPALALAGDWKVMYNSLLQPPAADLVDYLVDIERIELKFHPDAQTEFRSEMEAARRAKPSDPVREMILPLIVFVDQDGTERKLLE